MEKTTSRNNYLTQATSAGRYRILVIDDGDEVMPKYIPPKQQAKAAGKLLENLLLNV